MTAKRRITLQELGTHQELGTLQDLSDIYGVVL